ncbi:ATP-binding protein [Ideonella azotifigens]|uniref:histidine kinase n=2 Tax=Ideonella azotifigens TaxID=513160 RepID=A0ABP3V7E9_9BURK|nr:ATP-binding protein [Ideonella azotifigens]MCD2342583.1 ATP-binding protein [Ideonella azotifigens]
MSSSLVTRMLLAVAAASLLIFLLIGGFELWHERNLLTREAQARADAAVALSADPMANALWNYDLAALQRMTQGLVKDGSIVHAEVRNERGELQSQAWRAGAGPGPGLRSRELALSMPLRSQSIGLLTVQESDADVNAEIQRRAVDRLPLELLKVLAVAVSLLLLMHRLVISRLSALVRQLRNLRVDDLQARLQPTPQPANTRDEIVVLARGIERYHHARVLEMQRRQHAEEQLRGSLQERSAMLGSLREGLLGLDALGRVQYANRALGELLGLDTAPTRGQGLQGLAQLDSGDGARDFGDALCDGIAAGQPAQLRAELSPQVGQPRTVQIQLTPLGETRHGLPQGQTPGVAWIVVIADISDAVQRRRSEQARMAAEAASQAKSDFLSRMSHELRTPLNAIVGFAQSLTQDPAIQADAQRLNQVALIERAGWHLRAMIADVLDLSRIETGSLRINRGPVDLQALVDDAMALVAGEAAREQVHCSAEVDPRARWAMADEVRVQQVLLNLLGNAVKYNRPGGDVALQVSPAGDGEVCIEVSDTGLGMDEQQQAGLFQSFNRLGRELGGKPGAGIGLVVTRSLLDMMGGRIEVDSEAGVGTRFRVTLPAAAPTDDQQLTLPFDSSASTRHTVAYIEDDPVNTLVMSALVEQREDLQLVTYTNLGEGLAGLRARRPDLLLLDMQLPDGRGTELLAKLQREPALATLPVIMVSADALDDSVRNALAAGARAYVTKPLAFDEVLREIDAALQAGKAPPQAA